MNKYSDPLHINGLDRSIGIYLILAVLLILVATYLRFDNLSARSMWIDEAVAAINSQESIQETIKNTRQHNTSPIVFPVILYAVQRFGRSTDIVRMPSAVFSLIAVLIILALPRVGVDRRVAFVAATTLTLSPSQIHWAQEAREYSLSVLLAAFMIYGLFAFLHSDGRKRAALYVSLIAAPLIQYGLVLFGLAVIATLGLARSPPVKQRIGDVMKAGIAMGIGSIATIIITLRYQWRAHANIHLDDFFYGGSLAEPVSVGSFLARNTYSTIKYLMLEEVLVAFFLIAFVIYAYRLISNRNDCNELILFILAYAVAVVAVLFDAYPYGAAHQCLYLAPVTVLAFGGTIIGAADRLNATRKNVWAGIAVLAVVGLGIQSLQERNPYAEIEDIKSVLTVLEKSKTSDDSVYVYPSAGPALKFYEVTGDLFVFGTLYPQFDPPGYRNEINSAMEMGNGRLWIILSSTTPDVQEFAISQAPKGWHIEKKLAATKAALYLATITARN